MIGIVVVYGMRISTVVMWLLFCVFIGIDGWIVHIIPFSRLLCLLNFVAFLWNTSRGHAVISWCDARWTISNRFLSLVNYLRTAPWRTLLLCTTHIAMLLYAFTALGSWLPTHGFSLIQNTWCGESISEFTREVILSPIFLLATVSGIAAAPATLTLHIEPCTWFELTVAESVLWGSAASALLQKVIRVIVYQVYLWSLLLLILCLWLSWESLVELCIAFIKWHINVSLILKRESVGTHHFVGLSLEYTHQSGLIQAYFLILGQFLCHLFHFPLYCRHCLLWQSVLRKVKVVSIASVNLLIGVTQGGLVVNFWGLAQQLFRTWLIEVGVGMGLEWALLRRLFRWGLTPRKIILIAINLLWQYLCRWIGIPLILLLLKNRVVSLV